jgi:hypothetical protein
MQYRNKPLEGWETLEAFDYLDLKYPDGTWREAVRSPVKRYVRKWNPNK